MQAVVRGTGRVSGAVARLLKPQLGSVRFYPAIANCNSCKGGMSGAEDLEKSVFISQSADVYTNLALEDWMYKNFDFSKHRVLLLWRNDPAVVIGRHQNPWTEVNVEVAEESGIDVARRNSGGGCVYHDKGNLNCTFFTPRDGYDRKSNLETICRALDRQFGIKAEVTPRLDVTLDGYKVSGTASKLGKNAYHHCTVLVEADLKKLSNLLNPDTEGYESKATASIKSPVQNLKEANSETSVEKVLSSIGYEFLRTTPDGNDGGKEHITKQRGFQMVNPTNEWFPGLDELKMELKSWGWTFGRTPDFALKREYLVGQDINNLENINVNLEVNVIKGVVSSATLRLPSEGIYEYLDPVTVSDLHGFMHALKDRQFHPRTVHMFEELLFRNSMNKPVSATECAEKPPKH